MKIHAILNKDGGTLKTTDLGALSALLEDEFRLHGHEIDVEQPAGGDVVGAITRAAARRDIDVLMVGGGDGTVSAAAMLLMNTPLALAILPAGTMNLFARTLQMPLNLADAVAALSDGHIVAVDIASVNGRPFVHQFAVGLHARMVRLRERFTYGSRLGKMMATTRAVFLALRQLPLVDLVIDIDGEERRIRTPAVAISNNVYGDGHLPYADDPCGGTLGLYICETHDVRSMAKLTLDILVGNWRRNPALTVYEAKRVVIEYRGAKRRNRAVQDGELQTLDARSEIVLHEKALKVLAPREATFLPMPVAADV